MRSWIYHAGEIVRDPSPSVITQLVAAAQPFWLDIEDPTDEIIDQLATSLGLHPVAVENAKQFGQPAKLQVYRNGALIVGFGLDAQPHEPVEVHCYCTTGYLITLRRVPSPALDALRQAGSVHPQPEGDPIRALHPVISSLYTQFSALYLRLDQRLDELEQRVLREPNDEELAEITATASFKGPAERRPASSGANEVSARPQRATPAPPRATPSDGLQLPSSRSWECGSMCTSTSALGTLSRMSAAMCSAVSCA